MQELSQRYLVRQCRYMTTDESLTGLWQGDDGAVYYVRHHAGRIWWAGLSVDSPLGIDEFHPGVRFANVFCGRLVGKMIIGEWADTPRGGMPQNGVMDLAIESNAKMRAIHQVGGFGCTEWERADPPPRIDVAARLAEFGSANQQPGNMHAETAVVHGAVVTEPALLDGDIILSVRPDPTLCRISGFPTRIVGQSLRVRVPGLTGSTLLPGWNQRDGNSVLFRNGRPINGDVDETPDGSVRILGRRITPGTEVRLTGFLSARPGELEHDDSDRDEYLLLSPVYSIDTVDPVAGGTLTGTWTADDGGMYYMRQVGNTLWWLGLSHDQGRTFSNVFCGTITQSGAGVEVSGDLVDVPLGVRLDASRITLNSPENPALTMFAEPAKRWAKLSETSE